MRGFNFVHQFQRKIEDLRAAQKADLSTARAVEGVLRLDVLKAAPQNLVRARNEGKTLLDRDVQYRRRELAEAWQRIDKRIDGVVRDLRLVRPQLHGTFDPKTVFTRLWGLVHWFFVQPYDLACQADLATRWFEWQSLFAPHIQNQKPETLAEIWGVLPSALEAYVTTLPETRRRMQNALDAARKAKEAVQQSLARGAMGYRAALRYRGIGY
ncbi:uncharacterized protein JCM10292_005818 [Rhodotorula paludigena]|uniref:uncharacterized protein n=1 Tax=Rhodotorula paludigena TaxID=86838 RepID=UPI003179D7B6